MYDDQVAVIGEDVQITRVRRYIRHITFFFVSDVLSTEAHCVRNSPIRTVSLVGMRRISGKTTNADQQKVGSS
jgi:hypothetical protein